jgi:hypothetical protein
VNDQPVLATPEDAQAMQERAQQLYEQSGTLGNEADLLLASSELTFAVTTCQADLEHAESGLDEARQQLARATAAYDPVAAQLEQVRQQLADSEQDATDETLIYTVPLADRLAASRDRLALEYEVARLEPMAEKCRGAVRSAQDLVVNYERESLPHFRAALADAESMLADPPLDDFSRLVESAPKTAQRRAMRMGLMLLYLIAGQDSPHATQLRGAVYLQLSLSGYLDGLHDEWLRGLLAKLPPGVRNAAQAALRPLDLARPDHTAPPTTAHARLAIQNGTGDALSHSATADLAAGFLRQR